MRSSNPPRVGRFRMYINDMKTAFKCTVYFTNTNVLLVRYQLLMLYIVALQESNPNAIWTQQGYEAKWRTELGDSERKMYEDLAAQVEATHPPAPLAPAQLQARKKSDLNKFEALARTLHEEHGLELVGYIYDPTVNFGSWLHQGTKNTDAQKIYPAKLTLDCLR